jgi:hypothetical protein
VDVPGSHASEQTPKPGQCIITIAKSRKCLSKLGIRVYIPSSVYKNGLYLLDRFLTRPKAINSTILYWVDARIKEWIKSHPNKNSNDLLKTTKNYKFVIYDHWGFRCSVSPTGLCNGLHRGSKRRIDASIYFKIETTNVPDRGYIPPHTVMTSKEVAQWAQNNYWNKGSKPGKYYWGTIAIDNIGLLVIPHELDHAIGIHHPISANN